MVVRRWVQAGLSAGSLLAVGFVAAAAVSAITIALVWRIGNDDATEHAIAIDAVVAVQHLEAAWNIELARVRNDPMADFDSLANITRRTVQLKAGLIESVQGTPGLTRPLLDTASELIAAIAAKETQTERFKRHYAALRYATGYLPSVTLSLAEAPDMNSALLRDFVAASAMVDGCMSDPNCARSGEAEAALADLRTLPEGLTRTTASALGNFVSQATVLIKHQAPLHQAYAQAVSSDVPVLAEALVDGLRNAAAAGPDRGQLHRYGLLAAGATLLLICSTLTLLVYRRVKARQNRDADNNAVAKEVPVTPSLVAHTALTQVVAKRLTKRAQAISESVESLTVVRHYARSEGTRKAQAIVDIRGHAQEIKNEASRLADFAKGGGDTNITRIHIGECIGHAIQATEARTWASVAVNSGDVPPVLASRVEMYCMLENIVANAVQAVRTANGKKEVAISTERSGDHVVVEVADSGTGMAPAACERARQSCYSENGTRLGVGFATVNHLVAKYQGEITIRSAPGAGTTVRITLPIATPNSAQARAEPETSIHHADDANSPA